MTQDFNALFADAQQALAQNDLAGCLALLDRLEAGIGPHPAVLHLRALCLAQGGKLADAATAFAQAIDRSGANPDPVLLANAARLAWDRMDYAGGQRLLQDAARLAPDDAAIQALHISAIRRNTGDDAAETAFAAVLKAKPDWAAMWHFRALFLRDAGRHSDALSAIRRARALNPASANARHLEARLLFDLGQDAAGLFEEFCRAHPDDQDALCGWAAALFQSGDLDRALATLDAAIERRPDFYGAIDCRVRMTSQARSVDEAAAWLTQRSHGQPGDAELARLRTQFIWRAKDAVAAAAISRPLGSDASLLDTVQQAELLSDGGDFRGAETLFEEIEADLARAPAQLRMALPRHYFRAGEAERATQLAFAIASQTNLVEAWSYVEAGWRLTGDPRWDWLMRGGDVVRSFDLPSFAEYQAALVQDLHRLHGQMKNQPYEQSVRGGTQTDGFLLGRAERAIQALRRDLDASVALYIQSLEQSDRGHPLARLAGGHSRIVGSWSVALQSAGHHSAHFHSEGLLSSACYIALPSAMGDDEAVSRHDGWIEFGRPPKGSGLDLEPFAQVEPAEGKLVLFPSFLFHGTRPFTFGERLTVAFDIADIRL
ncbi:putative 2OG-Fe(II) oxygenase [Qipengyuania zhejiangensis]|uniref:putative 2OG-Fe(II) oxygenase n=1 Tax=Qipengyuania zhejiangensis TaxID=3077782 RepID=UPI002D79E21C|nr:putative 2OG-Fe(II) oxygenase [Qipengyuania sp. Z2]